MTLICHGFVVQGHVSLNFFLCFINNLPKYVDQYNARKQPYENQKNWEKLGNAFSIF